MSLQIIQCCMVHIEERTTLTLREIRGYHRIIDQNGAMRIANKWLEEDIELFACSQGLRHPRSAVLIRYAFTQESPPPHNFTFRIKPKQTNLLLSSYTPPPCASERIRNNLQLPSQCLDITEREIAESQARQPLTEQIRNLGLPTRTSACAPRPAVKKSSVQVHHLNNMTPGDSIEAAGNSANPIL